MCIHACTVHVHVQCAYTQLCVCTYIVYIHVPVYMVSFTSFRTTPTRLAMSNTLHSSDPSLSPTHLFLTGRWNPNLFCKRVLTAVKDQLTSCYNTLTPFPDSACTCTCSFQDDRLLTAFLWLLVSGPCKDTWIVY